MTDNSSMDVITQRPRTPNDQYTVLTKQQIKNISKTAEASPHFHITKPKVFDDRRKYMDRHATCTNQYHLRGKPMSQPYDWIDFQWSRYPAEKYDTCRDGASFRWGPSKTGERTLSHYQGETIDRYTTIDMYRRPATNNLSQCVMSYGRPSYGYYTQRYPSKSTWFGASTPLNQTNVLQTVPQKTKEEYDNINYAQQCASKSRDGKWPDYSEYTDKLLLRSKTEPRINNLEQKKRYVQLAEICV
ncbi:unnamed protein product [Owenia fusiformis]|uniref:Uncharacterized protein n=1 Tax=Owenia fusiformis TaxID=6347 RepID=A0A8J1UBG0_OWEFU|nr:unnamed protein product [Owenia fusiformis]